MGSYVKLNRIYDSLVPYGSSYRIYRDVMTGREIELEEGSPEKEFLGRNHIISWEEYQKRLELQKFGTITD